MIKRGLISLITIITPHLGTYPHKDRFHKANLLWHKYEEPSEDSNRYTIRDKLTNYCSTEKRKSG